MAERLMPNRCIAVRAQIEGKAYRMISFFHDHPSEIPQNEWNTFRMDTDVFIVDKLTYALMGECQCEFLVNDKSESEPSIVAVKLTEKKSGIKGN